MDYTRITGAPDGVHIQEDNRWISAGCEKGGWTAGESRLRIVEEKGRSRLLVECGPKGIRRIHLRWKGEPEEGSLFMGDQWERAYGDLEWAGIRPERNLPWYFLAQERERCWGVGVETGPSAMCFWRVDEEGVSLFLDLRNGTEAVLLGERCLEAAVLRVHRGDEGERAYRVHREFCRRLCPDPVLPDHPVYGGNNWYYTYGISSSREEILRDSVLMSELCGAANRPYMVIDNGWQSCSYFSDYNGGPWDRGNHFFPDMPSLAGAMEAEGVRPGIWFRPLQTVEKYPFSWRRFSEPQGGYQLDPSLPEVLDIVRRDTSRMTKEWGFKMIKHDFSTRDIFGTYGNRFGNKITRYNEKILSAADMISQAAELDRDDPCVPFADRSRTGAEIVKDFYRAVADGAGEALVIGCNTLTHLAAGIIPIQRTGEDTSSFSWEKTRRHGVNALSHRMGQHGTFYHVDADCVGIDGRIPWEVNREWLRLLADSGTPLFVSAGPEAVNNEIRRDLKAAFRKAAEPGLPAEPLNWTASTTPIRWKVGDRIERYGILRTDGREMLYEK